VRQLKAEGVFDLQKELALPPFCMDIAVVSSATAAGYGDFENQLAESPFAFRTQLFTAVMQGEQVDQSVIEALERIYHSETHFDCVVIIRGGGATADLSGFDTLALAENVAQFPLPIITGIGHDRDESILDMVSHTRVKTPTAAAQLLISLADQTLRRIENCEERIVRATQGRLEIERLRLTRLADRIPPLFSLFQTRQEARLDQLLQRLTTQIQRKTDREHQRLDNLFAHLTHLASHLIDTHRHRLQLMEQRAKSLDPTLLLSRGYSITLLNGHALRSPDEAKPGDEIETRLEKGTLRSTVTIKN
jgi:exodeoxyribonuclease VII large subunit